MFCPGTRPGSVTGPRTVRVWAGAPVHVSSNPAILFVHTRHVGSSLPTLRMLPTLASLLEICCPHACGQSRSEMDEPAGIDSELSELHFGCVRPPSSLRLALWLHIFVLVFVHSCVECEHLDCGLRGTLTVPAQFLPGVESRQSLPGWNGPCELRVSAALGTPVRVRLGSRCEGRVRVCLPAPWPTFRAQRGGSGILRSSQVCAYWPHPRPAVVQAPQRTCGQVVANAVKEPSLQEFAQPGFACALSTSSFTRGGHACPRPRRYADVTLHGSSV